MHRTVNPECRLPAAEPRVRRLSGLPAKHGLQAVLRVCFARPPRQSARFREDHMIARRTLLKGASLVAMSAAVSGVSVRESAAQQVPFSSGTEAPRLKAPANACDCHMHIYDARFPGGAERDLAAAGCARSGLQ